MFTLSVALMVILATGCGPAAMPAPTPTPVPTIAQPTITPKPPEPTATPMPVTVKVWTFLNPDGDSPREKALKKIIEDFEAANPTITIAVETIPYKELVTQFAAAASAGTAPDICWFENIDVELIEQGVLADMSHLFEADKDDFFPAMYEAASFGYPGKIYGMVIWPAGANVIFYRKDLFREAGIEVPLKTWDDFIEAGKKLTVDKDKDGKIDQWGWGMSLGVEATGENPFQVALMELQGTIFDIEKRKALYANENGVKAMTLMTDFITKHKITPKECLTWNVEDKYEQFAAGRFAMINGYGPRFKKVQRMASGWDPNELGVMRWPSFTGEKPGYSFVGGWKVLMWAGSPHPEEAGKFVQYLFSKEAAEVWMKIGGQLPARVSLLEDPYFDEPGNEYLKDLLDALKDPAFVWIWPGLNMAGYQVDIHTAAQQIVLEGRDVMEALKEAEEAFNARQK